MHLKKSIYKGAKPIEKNVIVVDEQGNEYEATYPKRAKGLVKNGRARFVGENKICLACPPDKSEENKMMDNIETINEEVEIAKAKEAEENGLLTVDYILSRIEKISEDTEYLKQAIATIEGMQTPEDVVDMSGAQKAQGLADIVRCRETTNQKLIEFYKELYNDIKPQRISAKDRLNILTLAFDALGEEAIQQLTEKLLIE